MEQKKLRIPYIEKNNHGISTLYVKEQPFLMLGGELHNSAASSLAHMEQEVWPYLRQIPMNTVILPIAWESIEDQENVFDFSLLYGIIQQARREEKKIVLLWFGLWKNGESTYVPSWVKVDQERFFHACYPGSVKSNTISPFCDAAIKADCKAFCRLMEFVKEEDEAEQTIVMVQVENEIGFLKAERDYSKAACMEYAKQVPELIQRIYHVQGTWQEALKENAPEYFMAYHYAQAVETITTAGKTIYSIPMYVNAWLEQHPDIPGLYPSGGPVAKLIPLWQQAAPSLDFIAPDIYVWDFKKTCEAYSVSDNPLFIPEARRDPVTASNAFYAFGGMNAMGFSPFAVEDFLCEDNVLPDAEQLLALNIDMSGFCCSGTAPYLIRSYEVLKSLLPTLLEKRGTDEIAAFIQNHNDEKGEIISLENFDLQIDYVKHTETKSGSAGIVIKMGKGYLIAGCNAAFMPLAKKGSEMQLTIVRLEEGTMEDGIWKRGRILNGDELNEMKLGDLAEIKYLEIIRNTMEEDLCI